MHNQMRNHTHVYFQVDDQREHALKNNAFQFWRHEKKFDEASLVEIFSLQGRFV